MTTAIVLISNNFGVNTVAASSKTASAMYTPKSATNLRMRQLLALAALSYGLARLIRFPGSH